MKITRSTFTRKALTFGIIVFMSVALVASGFAAWLISSGSKVEGEGNIKVEVVDHANIKINIDNLGANNALSNAQINFAPKSDDHEGYITGTSTSADLGGETLYENLSFVVTGNVTNGDKVGTLSFSMKVSDGVCYAAGFEKNGDAWTYNPAKAYIHLPSYVTDSNGNALPKIVKTTDGTSVSFTEDGETEPVKLTVEGNDVVDVTSDGFSYKYNSTSGKYEIKATYVFGWGEAVNGGNPGNTLDALETSDLPACVKKNGTGAYSLEQAELVILLINAIVNEQTVNGVDAHSINPTTLDDATIVSYIETLSEMQKDMSGAGYTVIIEALPKA